MCYLTFIDLNVNSSSNFISIAVIKYFNKNKNKGGEDLFGLQFQAHHFGEFYAGIQEASHITSIVKKVKKLMHPCCVFS